MLIGIGATDKTSLVAYQNSNKPLPMLPHGHPDPNTLINQGAYDPAEMWPESVSSYLAGGDKPGTFFRDLSGVNNQIPRWAWFVSGGVCLVLSAIAYNRYRKEKKGRK